MGPSSSETYQAILDATETVMREEGYAAVSSRRICEVAGVKQQLLYYYFKTMDEVLISAFRRRTTAGLERLHMLLEAEAPLQAIWSFMRSGIVPSITFEYMALANHHAGVRAEIAAFMEKTRAIQFEAVETRWPKGPAEKGAPTPKVAVFLIQACALMLEREISTGITSGHDEVLDYVEALIKASTA